MFAHLNDDVLFGEVWNEDAISLKTKCIITVVSLMASGITDSSLTYHLQNAKNHGVTKEEIAAIITHATMYAGWPKGWAVFRLAKEVWNEEIEEISEKDRYQNTIFFPIGQPNDGFAQYFAGQRGSGDDTGQRGKYPCGSKTLAWRGTGFLVFPSCAGGSRRRDG